ncbi:MAG TPA: 6-phosphogluconolactonase [Rhabdaerophilum sp.]|nr:6-phosphogluconolactonase [Rhabdaerophilum sp.]
MLLIRFPSLAAASETLAERVADRLREVLARQAHASLALPGGTTPGLFLKSLGAKPVDWRRVIVLPGDERFVPLDDPRSNERQIRTLFAPVRDGLCDLLSLRGQASSPEEAARNASMRLREAGAVDIAVFGMGSDGHVASLFPGDVARAWVEAGDDPVIPTNAPDGSRRLSLSRSAILAARVVMLLVSGPEKQAIIEEAQRPGSPEVLPIRLLLGRPLTVFSAEY